MNKFKWDKLHVSVPMILSKEMFGDSSGFGFNVCLVDRASLFVNVFERKVICQNVYVGYYIVRTKSRSVCGIVTVSM